MNTFLQNNAQDVTPTIRGLNCVIGSLFINRATLTNGCFPKHV